MSVAVLAECAHIVGDAGKHPGVIECKGKATASALGNLAIGPGGAGTNSFSLTFDCGDGAYLRQGKPQLVDQPPK